jgi:hypothetical protein
MQVLVDDLVRARLLRGDLDRRRADASPRAAARSRATLGAWLHVRMITNGWRLGDRAFARELADGGPLARARLDLLGAPGASSASCAASKARCERAFAALDAHTQRASR